MHTDFFESHPDPMWIYDLETLRFLLVNHAAVAAYGYSHDEFLRMTIKEIRPPEDLDQLLASIRRAPEGLEESGVWRHRLKDGRIVFVDIRSSRIVFEDRPAKLVTARNVTERVTLERQNKALLEREHEARKSAEEGAHLLRIAGNAARLGGWAFSLEDGRIMWSEVTAEIHEAIPGKQPTSDESIAFYIPEHRERIRSAFSRCLTEGLPFDETLQIITGGRRKRWVRAIGEAMYGADGEISGAQGAFQDVSELVSAREKSRRLEQRLRETLDSIGEGFLILDRDWRLIYANLQAAQLVNESADQIIGKSIFDVFPGVRGSVFEATYRRAIATNSAISFVEYFAPLQKWFEVNATPSTERLAIYFRDVTRARAEQEQLLLLQTAVSRLNDIVLITEAEPIAEPGPRIVYVNEAFERRTGYSRDEAIGRSPRFLQGELTQRQELDRIGASLKHMRPIRAELINYTKAGDPFWLELDIVPIADASGRFTHWVSVDRDITDRKLAERELALSEERFRLVGRAAGEAIWDWNLHDDTLWWSEGMQTLFGHDPLNLPQKSDAWPCNIHPDDRSRVEAGIRAVISGNISQWSDEYRFVRADGTIADVINRGFVMRDEEGRPARMVGSMVDVTERRSLEAMLRQTQRLDSLGQLTGGVAHDFNNLLTVILGNSAVLEEMLSDDPHLGVLAELTRKAAERGAELTNRLLSFSRRQTLEPKPTDVNQLLAGMDALLRRTIGGAVDVKMALMPQLWTSLIDAGQLENAVLNLCINARDAMPAGGELIVETANIRLDSAYAAQHPDISEGAYVMVAVTDTGSGMSADVLSHAFEPFFTTKDVGKGSGLGLSMVYGFAKQSRGHAKIYSEVGYGTTVKLYLPRSDALPETPSKRSEASLPKGDEKILVVEDDDIVRAHVAAQLRGLGYHVVAVANGVAAIHNLKESADFDLLFTDVVMAGGVNGPELALEARQLRPELPVLFTSGYTENAMVHQGCLDAGAQLLSKPYQLEDLAIKVRTMLDKAPQLKG